MRRLSSLVVLALVIAAPLRASANDLATVVDAYLRVQETLAADKTAGIREHATTIVTAAGRLGAPAQPLVAAARQLQGAGTLPVARDAFFGVTTALFKYADATKTPLGDEVRRAYCPMEKKSWAQKDGQIANPYGGSKMLRCGEFTDGRKS